MSKYKTIILEKKEEINVDKMETITNIDKSGVSDNISKTKISKKEEKINDSLSKGPLPQKEKDKNSNISIVDGTIKSQKEKQLQKYNNDKFSYFTFNNKMQKYCQLIQN